MDDAKREQLLKCLDRMDALLLAAIEGQEPEDIGAQMHSLLDKVESGLQSEVEQEKPK